MIDVAAELRELCELATALNRLPGVSRTNPESWHIARDHIARNIARGVGRIRKELGIAEERPATSFCVRQVDTGYAAIRHNGRAIPIERRTAR